MLSKRIASSLTFKIIEMLRSNKYLVISILMFSFVPIIGVQLYFRHDDSAILLWASEFNKPFYLAFSLNPEVNQFENHQGMNVYYRPFTYIYLLFMQRIFGNDPFWFQLAGGLMMIGLVVIIYKVAEMLIKSKFGAFLSTLVLLIAFYPLFYVSYHVMTPFEYLLELSCFYFVFLGLHKQKIHYLILSLVVLLPATTRQTAPIIYFAMLCVFFFMNRNINFPTSRKAKLTILGVACLPILTIPFSSISSGGTILSVPFSSSGYFLFIMERINFYGKYLASGLGAFVVWFGLFFWLGLRIQKVRASTASHPTKLDFFKLLGLSFLSTLLVLLVFRPFSIYLLLALLLVAFFLDERVRLPLTWFFVSFGLFSMIDFYHLGYLFEAALGLSIVLGIFYFDVLCNFNEHFDVFSLKKKKKFTQIFAVTILVFGILGAWQYKRIPFLSQKLEDVKILIDTNQNFKEVMDFVVHDTPPNSTVYQLPKEYNNLTRSQRRFLNLRERAENVKVMNIVNTRAMVKTLGRYDIEIRSAEDISESATGTADFLIACSKLEKVIAKERYLLSLIKGIKRGDTEAAIYMFHGIKNRNSN